MKVEILFPEVGNLCGDLMNIRYLHQCCPELEVVETDLKSRPAFLEGGVDLVYMGSATEKGLELMVKALTPYREELAARVDGGQRMLVTGNALDALGEYVQSDQGLRFDGLGLLPTHAEYQMMNRHNSFFLGTYGTGMEIVGFKSLFGHTYGADDPGTGLFKVVRGVGRRPGSGGGLPPGRPDGHLSHGAAAGAEYPLYQAAAAGAGGRGYAGLRGGRHGGL